MLINVMLLYLCIQVSPEPHWTKGQASDAIAAALCGLATQQQYEQLKVGRDRTAVCEPGASSRHTQTHHQNNWSLQLGSCQFQFEPV